MPETGDVCTSSGQISAQEPNVQEKKTFFLIESGITLNGVPLMCYDNKTFTAIDVDDAWREQYGQLEKSWYW